MIADSFCSSARFFTLDFDVVFLLENVFSDDVQFDGTAEKIAFLNLGHGLFDDKVVAIQKNAD